MKPKQADGPQAAIVFPSREMPISEPMEIGVMFCGSDADSIEKIRVTAVMPAHQHGLNYKPVVKEIGPNSYVASGLFFHMPGQWIVEVAALSSNDPWFFEVEVEAK